MIRSQCRKFCLLRVATCVIAVLTMLPSVACRAQENQVPLRKSVSLHLGATTLKAVADALSSQTGLSVTTADYLEDHGLTLEADGLCAQDALDAIAEIGGWEWHSVSPGHILIERLAQKKPVTVTDVPSAMQQALTPDVRLFLSVGLQPIKDIEMLLGAGQDLVPFSNSQRVRAAAGDTASAILLPQLRIKLDAIAAKLNRRIANEMMRWSPAKTNQRVAANPSPIDNDVPLSSMSKSQTEYVTARLLIYELAQCVAHNNPAQYRMMTDSLAAFQKDPGLLRVSLTGSRLEFTYRQDLKLNGTPVMNVQGFAWSLDPAERVGPVVIVPGQ